MRLRLAAPRGRFRVIAAAALMAAGIAVFRRPLARVGGLVAGGAAVGFCLAPLSDFYERRLSRPAAALAAVLSACAGLTLALALLLPALLKELAQVGEALPRSVAQVAAWVNALAAWAEARLPGVTLPEFPMAGATGVIANLAAGAVNMAGHFADGASRLSMMLVLGYFFLRDRERLLLRLELMAPLSVRAAAVRAGRAVLRELRLYLQGQLMIAGAVAALAAAGLWLIGVRSALVLGGTVGLLNMVPYFGPFIGGIPATLVALGDGLDRAALCAAVLVLVQQADAAILSPRVMGSLSGFSPAAVLLIIYAGGSLAGIAGMFAALPLTMAFRTAFRIFVQNCENI